MNHINNYPRVLIIYNSCINKVDQHGVSLRQWFADWPKENLAQIYSGNEVGNERFCGSNFKLGKNERQLGSFFVKLKNSSIGQNNYPILLDKKFSKLNKLNQFSILKKNISHWLNDTGLWELVFRPLLSKEMILFIKNFAPQIIYCQGHVLTFAWLPLLIQKKFKIPICFQTGDDWPFYLYSSSPFSFVLKPIVKRSVKSLLLKSSIRLVSGSLMAKEYQERYNLYFEPLMQCDNIDRFRNAIPHRVVDDSTKSIVYSGSLGLGRWISIIELCEAAKQLEIKGIQVIITVFTNTIPPESVNNLQEIENLQILPGPEHDDLPSFLKGADILYLPEKFDSIQAQEIHLSISTKAQIYMMSEKPILVYAPSTTGIANYAKEEGWACLVEEQNVKKLTQELHKMLTDNEYSKKLVSQGLKVALKNHDERIIKTKFLDILNAII